MKKILLSLFMVFTVIIVMAQVPRKQVVMEVGTGTWCQYCPGAAMGADDLLENGCEVAVMENHNGDNFANTYSNARNSFYNITGYPTAMFDGVLKKEGGSHTTTMYGSYLPLYTQRHALPSNFDMTWEITNDGLNYTAVITLTKVAASTASNLKLQFSVTQSNIAYNWQGQTHLEHVNRLMVPDANGTAVDFSSGDVQTVTLNFTMNPDWPLEDCEFIAFLQANAGKEIQNGVKRGVIDLAPEFSVDNQLVTSGLSAQFTNMTTGGYIGVPESYHWIFPGGIPDTSNLKNPSITYNDCGQHDVTLIVNRGGQIDTITKPNYITVGFPVNVSATPGDTACHYQPITLDATTTGATGYLWTPGGATTPTITVDATEAGLGAHTYTVEVSKGTCTMMQTHEIFFDDCTGIEKVSEAGISIYPNPNNGSFAIESSKTMNASVKVISTLGATVFSQKDVTIGQSNPMNISLKNAPSGVYFVVVENGDQKLTKKMIIK